MAFKAKKEEGKILDVDASMQGNLTFKDPVNLRINGKFEGNLETKGNLTIGPGAVVLGDIRGDSVVIGGKVKGRITAKQELLLQSGAIVEGDISPVRLSIESGAIFEGKCSMLAEVLNAEELARYLEVEMNSILEWANAGRIPALKQGNDWTFERKAIDAWIAEGKIGR
ncbi:MAG TPA: polymer-forming cytoskeletal protein [Candidatus Omnitrophota bacterium]|jgi:excisionase family DNA binding protein|nr:polymer-forming cytoskeletal protein [Candidatus Omnitrophota bacterium]HRZ15145.1 polymer-forming cytoskeletal protein [Candidatus Omnitrophota bacterium]